MAHQWKDFSEKILFLCIVTSLKCWSSQLWSVCHLEWLYILSKKKRHNKQKVARFQQMLIKTSDIKEWFRLEETFKIIKSTINPACLRPTLNHIPMCNWCGKKHLHLKCLQIKSPSKPTTKILISFYLLTVKIL